MLVRVSRICASGGDFCLFWAYFGLFGLISGLPGGEMLVRVSTICASGGDFSIFLDLFWPILAR